MIIIPQYYNYMAAIRKRNVKAAYEWCLANGCNSCKVNTMYVTFDFSAKTGKVWDKFYSQSFSFEEE